MNPEDWLLDLPQTEAEVTEDNMTLVDVICGDVPREEMRWCREMGIRIGHC